MVNTEWFALNIRPYNKCVTTVFPTILLVVLNRESHIAIDQNYFKIRVIGIDELFYNPKTNAEI